MPSPLFLTIPLTQLLACAGVSAATKTTPSAVHAPLLHVLLLLLLVAMRMVLLHLMVCPWPAHAHA